MRKGKHVVTTNSKSGREIVRSGNIILSEAGKAEVQVLSKEEFRALSEGVEHVYTLTSIGGANPNLHVESEIMENGNFVIAGGKMGRKISWTVRS
jgi:hypothetical protein